MTARPPESGRSANAAQPLGERAGLVSDAAAKRTGEQARKAAGPDGPDAGAVGATFKSKPKQRRHPPALR